MTHRPRRQSCETENAVAASLDSVMKPRVSDIVPRLHPEAIGRFATRTAIAMAMGVAFAQANARERRR